MVLYRLSFFTYLKEKIKEILSFSGTCKGDIFLNPALKAGQNILREYYHDDHIIHAIRYFSTIEGYGSCYCDVKAEFGAIATEVSRHFKKSYLYEKDDLLRDILRVNMSLKAKPESWHIMTKPDIPKGKAVIRCESLTDLNKILENEGQIIVFQSKFPGIIAAPHHDLYLYSAGMDKNQPFRTLWTLMTKGYVFKLKKIKEAAMLPAADYVLIPKELVF